MKDFFKLGGMAIGLIALAAIVLSGIAVLQEYQNTLQGTGTITNESTTVSSGSATLANDEITLSSFRFENGTAIFVDGNVSSVVEVNLTEAGSLTTSLTDANYNSSYNYDTDTTGSNTATQFIAGLAIFAAFVGILAISVIGMIVIQLFRPKGGQKMY